MVKWSQQTLANQKRTKELRDPEWLAAEISASKERERFDGLLFPGAESDGPVDGEHERKVQRMLSERLAKVEAEEQRRRVESEALSQEEIVAGIPR